ncbi:MAG: pyridoxine 5'-phosphate synthase [Chitinophagales bacterium]|jgi:pyridoxine 5-phosphate synthase|nr:pyridoxine 5'-phosphate synthase [Chitinophagales bacterium]
MATKLSVNINKVATLRNTRRTNIPDVTQFALDCYRYLAEGITVHPRPDERHIRYRDVLDLAQHFPRENCEYNIEGYPTEAFIDLVCQVKPTQVTLVPDAKDVLTSEEGWQIKAHVDFLTDVVQKFQSFGIRVSLFVDTDLENLDWAKKTKAERIEFYTGTYAHDFKVGDIAHNHQIISPFVKAANHCASLGLGVNAGHDLNLDNLHFFASQIPNLQEVSIGHAFVRDCLYFGLENTIGLYKKALIY